MPSVLSVFYTKKRIICRKCLSVLLPNFTASSPFLPPTCSVFAPYNGTRKGGWYEGDTEQIRSKAEAGGEEEGRRADGMKWGLAGVIKLYRGESGAVIAGRNGWKERIE